jgi:hypothetical protein
MKTETKKREYVTWDSLKSLPRFYDFLEEQGFCATCVDWEVADEILEQTGVGSREELFHEYKRWYLDNA